MAVIGSVWKVMHWRDIYIDRQTNEQDQDGIIEDQKLIEMTLGEVVEVSIGNSMALVVVR